MSEADEQHDQGDQGDGAYRLPDGSGVAFGSYPLPKDHWLYQRPGPPPMSYRLGTGPDTAQERAEWADRLRAAARYAVRCATVSGTEADLDPDAVEQSLIVGVLGLCTRDGLTTLEEDRPWSDPQPVPPVRAGLHSYGLLVETIGFLWGLLDDVDTVSDAARSNDAAYRAAVERIQKRRWETGITTNGYVLDLAGLRPVESRSAPEQ